MYFKTRSAVSLWTIGHVSNIIASVWKDLVALWIVTLPFALTRAPSQMHRQLSPAILSIELLSAHRALPVRECVLSSIANVVKLQAASFALQLAARMASRALDVVLQRNDWGSRIYFQSLRMTSQAMEVFCFRIGFCRHAHSCLKRRAFSWICLLQKAQ